MTPAREPSPQPSTSLPETETLSLPASAPAWPLLSLAAAILALLLFGWLAERTANGYMPHFDSIVRGRVHSWASPGLTRIMFALSFLGREGIVLGSLASLVVFWRRRWKRAALWLVITMLGSLALEVTLKLAFHRPRPQVFFGPLPHSYSFPSGHSLSSFCFYGILAGLLGSRLRSKRWRCTMWLTAALVVGGVGVSRIYLGVHYPSDVIGGYLAAAVWVSAMLALDRFRLRHSRS